MKAKNYFIYGQKLEKVSNSFNVQKRNATQLNFNLEIKSLIFYRHYILYKFYV